MGLPNPENPGTIELSPLVAIREKELELSHRLAEARQAAERAILEARQWAAAYRDRAEREGQASAAALYRAELEAADAEAAQIRAEGEKAAARITEHGRQVLDQAVQVILEFVLPSGCQVGEASPERGSKDR